MKNAANNREHTLIIKADDLSENQKGVAADISLAELSILLYEAVSCQLIRGKVDKHIERMIGTSLILYVPEHDVQHVAMTLQQLLEQIRSRFSEPCKLFRCYWGDGYPCSTDETPHIECHGSEYFCKENGYTKAQIESVDNLKPLQSADFSDDGGNHFAIRIK